MTIAVKGYSKACSLKKCILLVCLVAGWLSVLHTVLCRRGERDWRSKACSADFRTYRLIVSRLARRAWGCMAHRIAPMQVTQKYWVTWPCRLASEFAAVGRLCKIGLGGPCGFAHRLWGRRLLSLGLAWAGLQLSCPGLLACWWATACAEATRRWTGNLRRESVHKIIGPLLIAAMNFAMNLALYFTGYTSGP